MTKAGDRRQRCPEQVALGRAGQEALGQPQPGPEAGPPALSECQEKGTPPDEATEAAEQVYSKPVNKRT